MKLAHPVPTTSGQTSTPGQTLPERAEAKQTLAMHMRPVGIEPPRGITLKPFTPIFKPGQKLLRSQQPAMPPNAQKTEASASNVLQEHSGNAMAKLPDCEAQWTCGETPRHVYIHALFFVFIFVLLSGSGRRSCHHFAILRSIVFFVLLSIRYLLSKNSLTT